MKRYLVAAILLLQTTLIAQNGAASIPNPFAADPFWRFHLSTLRYAEMLEKAKSQTNPVDAIEANFAIGAKLAAVRAAGGLLTAAPSEFARGIHMLIEHSHDLNDDGTTLYREFMAFVAA